MAHIVADSGIPGVFDALSGFGTVELMDPVRMSASTLAQADILIVRSVARVGKEMLNGTRIRMVGSATAGTDHVDLDLLRDREIAFYHAPGANADSVADYVMTALLTISVHRNEPLEGRILGVVGHGQVGSRVARRAGGLGMSVEVCDPPLEAAIAESVRRGVSFPLTGSLDLSFCGLDEMLPRVDVLSIHTPLTVAGPHPTRHLMDGSRLGAFGGWLINTARGAVVDNAGLRGLLDAAKGPSGVVLDVWEGEPLPDPRLARMVDIGTCHVAGYATDSKWQATRMMAEAVADFLGQEIGPEGDSRLPTISMEAPAVTSDAGATGRGQYNKWLLDLALRMCPLDRDHATLKQVLEQRDPGRAFEAARSGYPGRRLMRRHQVTGVPGRLRAAVERGLTAEPV
ncbi:MAG: 4-phosphoerythronate dehydrogenase [Rhodothermales bacterium]|nr:4-phosphoerythronate dehydrogenase [Rhodothermales bacterium]